MHGYLTDGLWLEMAGQANDNASYLANGLRENGAEFLHHPDANMIFARFPRAVHQKLHAAGAKYYLWDGPLSGPADEMVAARLVCDWSMDRAGIDQFLSHF